MIDRIIFIIGIGLTLGVGIYGGYLMGYHAAEVAAFQQSVDQSTMTFGRGYQAGQGQ